MKIAIGVDVGGTNTKYGVFTETGNLLEKKSKPTKCGESGKHILPDIVEEILDLRTKFKKMEYELVGVGIGMPGPVLEDGFVENCVNLNLKNVNPEIYLSEKLHGLTISVGNDANVAALGELWKGSGEGYDSIIVITLGTGVGSGVVLNGRIVYGEKGLAGEIGHIIVNPNEVEVCNCGKRGCLDQIASAKGIVKTAYRVLDFTGAPSVLRTIKQLSAKHIVEAAKNGDILAYLVLDYCMSFLGKCLADVSYVVDPQVFVIGGGVSQGGTILTEIIKRHYEKNSTLVGKKTPILLAKLGNDAGIYGAAKMAFSKAVIKEGKKIC